MKPTLLLDQVDFSIDSRLTEHATALIDWPLSRVYLKHESRFPWLMLVPRVEEAFELLDLPKASRYMLMDEVSALEEIIKMCYRPTKINVGTLGNIVKQLHIHLVGRFEDDEYWPHSIWHGHYKIVENTAQNLLPLIAKLIPLLQQQAAKF